MLSQHKQMLLRECCRSTTYFNRNIGNLTSFKIGGPVDALVYPKDVNDLRRLLRTIIEHRFDYIVVGNLSNMLISNKGYKGIVICMREFSSITTARNAIAAQAGVKLSDMLRVAGANKLGGAEFYSGIPGTVGGAVVSNSGTMGFETSEILEDVKVLDAKSGRLTLIRGDALHYRYRRCILQRRRHLVVIAARFGLRRSERRLIQDKVAQFNQRKIMMQPVQWPSAGCVYISKVKGRHVNDMLRELGLCGHQIGGARISEKYPNYIINTGDATYSDVRGLMRIAKERVLKRFGIRLTEEIRIVE